MTPIRSLSILAGLLGVLPAQSSRSVVQLTQKAESHNGAVISPDGRSVAFTGPSKIGVVSTGGGSEGTLVSSSTLGGDLVWAPGSSGVYYRDGLDLMFVARAGGQPRKLATLPDGQHRLWCVDGSDTRVYLTRFVVSTRRFALFSVPTRGGPVSDLVSNALTMQYVQIDPSDQWLLFQESASGPFTQREFVRVDLQGANRVSLGRPPTAYNLGPGYWVDNGTTIVFSYVSPNSSGFHVGRLSVSNTTVQELTDGPLQRNNAYVAPGGAPWIVMQAQYGSGVGPAVMPVDGGGVVPLANDGQAYLFQSPATMDTAGTMVVFSARLGAGQTHVYAATLDRELQAAPLARVNNSFNVDMPVETSEIGALLISVPPTQAPVSVAPFRYGLVLNPSALFVLPSTRMNGALRATIAIPNNPWFVGQELLFQGARINSRGTAGDFTRHSRVRMF